MPGHYTVRYRRTRAGGRTLLIVEDEIGVPYLVAGAAAPRRLAADRLAAARARGGWAPVPAVAPYTADGLRRLLGAPAGGDRGGGGTPRAAAPRPGTRRDDRGHGARGH